VKLNDSLSGLASIIIPSCNPLDRELGHRRFTRLGLPAPDFGRTKHAFENDCLGVRHDFRFQAFPFLKARRLGPRRQCARQAELQDRPCRTVGLLHKSGCTQDIAARLVLVLQHRRELGANRRAITRLDRLNECVKKMGRVAPF
jgi:hypothetical protein